MIAVPLAKITAQRMSFIRAVTDPDYRHRRGRCARSATGHAAAPPSSVMNSRRFHWRKCIRSRHGSGAPRKHIGLQRISQRVWKASRREAPARPAGLAEQSGRAGRACGSAILAWSPARRPSAGRLRAARRSAGGVTLYPGLPQAQGWASPAAF
jgi:hypothetical protein